MGSVRLLLDMVAEDDDVSAAGSMERQELSVVREEGEQRGSVVASG
jgi:hypothetical protein